MTEVLNILGPDGDAMSPHRAALHPPKAGNGHATQGREPKVEMKAKKKAIAGALAEPGGAHVWPSSR